jgi:hypothetical protein
VLLRTKHWTEQEDEEHYIVRSFIICALLRYQCGGQIKEDVTGRHIARMEEMRNANITLAGKAEGTRPIRRPVR